MTAYTYRRLGTLGRLGNLLWQVAATLGLARAAGVEARLPAWPYESMFQVPDVFGDIDGCTDVVDAGLADFLPPAIRPYLQDLSLIRPVEDDLRTWFSWPDAPEPDPALNAVHVRRGDYVAKAQFHPPVTAEYISRGLALLGPGKVKVFSDDIPWCRANIDADEFQQPGQTDIGVLRDMARHGRHVLANSTFAWWGAWLSDAVEVVYPRNWFGPALPGLTADRFIPSGWVGL